MRKSIIAGNWKMNKTIGEAVKLVEELKPLVADVTDVDIVVAPTFIALASVYEVIKDSNIALAAQNMIGFKSEDAAALEEVDKDWTKEGAFTGEISPEMFKSVGCKYVIIGHSERRLYFGETNATVNNKVKTAHKCGLLPIVCVGEKLEERETGKTKDVVKEHVLGGLTGVTSEEILKTVIAYEPVWAIGTGKIATPEQAQEVHEFIRELLASTYSPDIADKVRVQYGGSVKPENIAELITLPDVDGALVGGASLKAESFAKIVKQS